MSLRDRKRGGELSARVCVQEADFEGVFEVCPSSGSLSNTLVEELHLYFSVDFQYELDGAKSTSSLLERTSLRSKHVSNWRPVADLEDFLVEIVQTNKLQKLDISRINLQYGSERRHQVSRNAKVEGLAIATALHQQSSILELVIPDLTAVLESFAIPEPGPCKVQDLTIACIPGEDDENYLAKVIGGILRTNESLHRLKLPQALFHHQHWQDILDSLKWNSTIQTLDVSDAITSMSELVLSKLLYILRINCPQITSIGIETYASDFSHALDEILPSLTEQLRLNKEYGRALQKAERSTPRSARVIFCGPRYAGKTTLCKRMTKESRYSRSQQVLFLQKRRRLWRLLYGSDAEKELDSRTRGVDTYVWKDMEDLRITLWDFAGQKEYYALHDYMFPNVNSANLFLFCFSMVPNPFDRSPKKNVRTRLQEIRKELLFWLYFLCSNSKELCTPKPKVRVVLTNVDRAEDSESKDWFQIEDIVHSFALQFQDRLDIITSVTFLNAHSRSMVAELELHILDDFRKLIPNLKPTFKICEDLRKILGHRKFSTPVITMEEFKDLCLDLDPNALRERELREAVASYLHSVGEIMYFKNVSFVVIDPKWLGLAVLGNILDLFGRRSTMKFRGIIGCFEGLGTPVSTHKVYLENGFVQWQGLRRLMRESLQLATEETGMKSEDLISLLLELEICFEDKIRGGYLIPAALDDQEEWASRGLRQLSWTAIDGERGNHIYFGRRLQCSDQERTVLTPGFFPRLQVVLQKHLSSNGFIGENITPPLEIDRNLLRFWHNAMDIIVEYGDCEQFHGNFIDVMVRTLRDYTRAVHFVKEHVLDVIRTFCAQPEGNQGVVLVEGIIRPVTVEHLIVCRDRENQAVLVSKLEEYVKQDINCQFCWDAVANAGVPCNKREPAYAIDTLKGAGFHTEMLRRKASEDAAVSELFDTLREPFSKVLGKLVREQLLADTPKLIYILEDKFDAWRVSRHDVALRLHLQCECTTNGPHLLKEQPGRSFVVEGALRQTLKPILEYSFELCKLAGIVTARSVPFLGALEVVIDQMPSQVSMDTPAFFDRKSLWDMGKRTPAQIVEFYEEALTSSPHSDWLRKFLDMEGKPEKFEADFRIHKVRYKDTQEVAFLCSSCRLQGFNEGFLQMP